jgi:hypothetical protein
MQIAGMFFAAWLDNDAFNAGFSVFFAAHAMLQILQVVRVKM